MADAGNPQADGLNKSQMKQYLVPAAAVAAVVVLAGLVLVASGSTRKMSDGSDGSATDAGLKDVSAGVKMRDIKEGTGDACPPGAAVKMHYTGWLADGTVFDSTREGAKAKGQTADFKLENLIKGWQEGIPGMKKGGIRKLVIAPDKGYGARDKGPIPANSTLVFEVELVDFTPGAAPPRARRDPIPTDLTKLSDGTAPGADDPGLQPLGSGGLKYRDLKVGDGPVCPEGATPIMDYIGWLTTGGTPFDNSFKGSPLDMPLGKLIEGWQQGVPGMRVGGIRKLVIPSSLGYGPQGSPPNIPGGATLVFEVELLGLK